MNKHRLSLHGAASILAAALLAPAFAAPGAPANAAVPAQARTIPRQCRLMLGQFAVTALSDGTVTLALNKLPTNTTPAELDTVMKRAGIEAEADFWLDPANAARYPPRPRFCAGEAGPGALSGGNPGASHRRG